MSSWIISPLRLPTSSQIGSRSLPRHSLPPALHSTQSEASHDMSTSRAFPADSEFSLHQVTPANSDTTIPATLRLIKALALFEKAPDEVFATEELLRDSFFGDKEGRKYAECVLIYRGGAPGDEGAEAVAMAVWYYTFSTVRLSSRLSRQEGRGRRADLLTPPPPRPADSGPVAAASSAFPFPSPPPSDSF